MSLKHEWLKDITDKSERSLTTDTLSEKSESPLTEDALLASLIGGGLEAAEWLFSDVKKFHISKINARTVSNFESSQKPVCPSLHVSLLEYESNASCLVTS